MRSRHTTYSATILTPCPYDPMRSRHTTYSAIPHYMTSQLRSFFLESSQYSVFDLSGTPPFCTAIRPRPTFPPAVRTYVAQLWVQPLFTHLLPNCGFQPLFIQRLPTFKFTAPCSDIHTFQPRFILLWGSFRPQVCSPIQIA